MTHLNPHRIDRQVVYGVLFLALVGLLIAGTQDRIVPPTVNKANADLYRNSAAHSDYYEHSGRDHLTIAAPGGEATAESASSSAGRPRDPDRERPRRDGEPIRR